MAKKTKYPAPNLCCTIHPATWAGGKSQCHLCEQDICESCRAKYVDDEGMLEDLYYHHQKCRKLCRAKRKACED